jgi:hypothetical protein
MQLLRESFVLQRRINVPLPNVERALGFACSLSRDANLAVDGVSFANGFVFVPSWPRHCWRARGRLVTIRQRKIARVDVEFGMWSDDASELVLRPVSSHPYRWSRRRQRAYFKAAHVACDELLRATTMLAMFEFDALVEAR